MKLLNVFISVAAYTGIILIIAGIIIMPSPKELKHAKLRVEETASEWSFKQYEDGEWNDYAKDLENYEWLKRREVLSGQLSQLGIGVILLSIAVSMGKIIKYQYPSQLPQTQASLQYPIPVKPGPRYENGQVQEDRGGIVFTRDRVEERREQY